MSDASKKIDAMIAGHQPWQSEILTKLRDAIHKADPNIEETWKWNTAVFVDDGLVCAISGFRNHVKINFFKGAQLKDANKIINAGFDSKDHRAIDYFEGATVHEQELIELIREAVALNK